MMRWVGWACELLIASSKQASKQGGSSIQCRRLCMWLLLFNYFTRNYRLIDQLQQRHSREYLTVHTAIAARTSLIILSYVVTLGALRRLRYD